MTLRITRINGEEGTFLRVDGRLEGESLAELEKACEDAPSPLTLDLEGLMSVDDTAAGALERLMARGATVIHASPYVKLLLESRLRDA